MKENLLARLEKQMVEKKQVIFKFSKTEDVIIEIDTKFLNNSIDKFVQEFFVYIHYMSKYDEMDRFLEIFYSLLIKYFSAIMIGDEKLDYCSDKSQSEVAFKQLLDYNISLTNITDVKGKRLYDFIITEIAKNKKQLDKLQDRMREVVKTMTDNQEEIVSMMAQLDTLKLKEDKVSEVLSEVDSKVIEDEVEMGIDSEGNKYANIQE